MTCKILSNRQCYMWRLVLQGAKADSEQWKNVLSLALRGRVPLHIRWPAYGIKPEFESDGKRLCIVENMDDGATNALVLKIRGVFERCPSYFSATQVVHDGKKGKHNYKADFKQASGKSEDRADDRKPPRIGQFRNKSIQK
jgi:hypothetical protein